MAGASLGKLYGFLGHSKRGVEMLRDAYPIRFKCVSIIDPPMVILQTFLSKYDMF